MREKKKRQRQRETERERGREGRERGREKKRKRAVGGRPGPFKRESSEKAQLVLLVAAPEGISCQKAKDRPEQMPKY